jgi:hypothetical protein
LQHILKQNVFFLGVPGAAKELPEGNLRPDDRVLANQHERAPQFPRDPPVPAAQEPRLQAQQSSGQGLRENQENCARCASLRGATF